MSASHSTFSKPEATTGFALYIPHLQRAELSLGLFCNNIADNEIRLIFDTHENMLAMSKQIERGGKTPLFCSRVDSNDRAMLVRSNLPATRVAPCKALSTQFPKPEAEDKDDDIKATYVASNFRINIPHITGAEMAIDYAGAPITNLIKLQFDTQEHMRDFVTTLKNSDYDSSLVYDRGTTDFEFIARLCLDVSNQGISIFNFMPEYFINLETQAFEKQCAMKASVSFASSAPAPKAAEDKTNVIRLG